MRAVVLGATGFLGGALSDCLIDRGHDVERLGSPDLDLRSPEAPRELARRLGPDAVLVSCSALTPPAGFSVAGLMGNLSMVASVASALEQAQVARCVYVSSDGVYGWSDEPVTERTRAEPVGYYPIAKYAGELVLDTMCTARDVPLLVLRPVAVFGPGDTHRAYGPNRFAYTAQKEGRILLFGGGEEQRDHLYVGDFAAYAAALLEREAAGIFNLASGTPRTFAEVAEVVRRLASGNVQIEYATRRTGIRHRRFDVARLRNAVPYVTLTDFDAALEATLAAI